MKFQDFESLREFMSVSKESMDYMKKIIKENKLKNVLEIGCFNGYSALNFSTVVKNVKTIEIDERVIEKAKKNIQQNNINNIEIIEGNALEVLEDLDEKFDLIFIDAMKGEYGKYLKHALRLINKNGFIFADNTLSHKEKMKDFFDYLENSKLKWKETNLGKGLIEISL